MAEFIPSADLFDQHGEGLQSCDTQFHQYGRRTRFQGAIVTVRCREDNALLRQVLSGPGQGKVAVVDGDGSLHCALLGDQMADLAVVNSWEGVIINGAVRDAGALANLYLGIKALGTNPRKSHKHGTGQTQIQLIFGSAVFTPGAHLVSDEDGVVVVPDGGSPWSNNHDL